jgi:hypothetical protein
MSFLKQNSHACRDHLSRGRHGGIAQDKNSCEPLNGEQS